MKFRIKNIKKPAILKLAAITLLIGIMAVFAASCRWTVGVVRGSGDIATGQRSVSGFDELHFSGIGNLVIQQGDEETLTIEADDNIIDLVETDVRGGKLYIKFRTGFNVIPTSRMRFLLTVRDLDRIDLSGVGDIECGSFGTDDIEFNISGSGNIDFVIETGSLEVNISGLGDINLDGKADFHRVNISGSGKYDAEDLQSNECEVEITGLGSATVDVREKLDVVISGAGNVYYTGDPSVSRSISGLGRIKSLD
jgi:hypothetical protein